MSSKVREEKIGQEVSQGTSTCEVYSIEVRLKGDIPSPFTYGRMIIDREWRHLSITDTDFGVPSDLFDPLPQKHGYVTYECAMALGYWFLASTKHRSVEFRLIRYKFETKHSCVQLGIEEPVCSLWERKMAERAK